MSSFANCLILQITTGSPDSVKMPRNVILTRIVVGHEFFGMWILSLDLHFFAPLGVSLMGNLSRFFRRKLAATDSR